MRCRLDLYPLSPLHDAAVIFRIQIPHDSPEVTSHALLRRHLKREQHCGVSSPSAHSVTKSSCSHFTRAGPFEPARQKTSHHKKTPRAHGMKSIYTGCAISTKTTVATSGCSAPRVDLRPLLMRAHAGVGNKDVRTALSPPYLIHSHFVLSGRSPAVALRCCCFSRRRPSGKLRAKLEFPVVRYRLLKRQVLMQDMEYQAEPFR
ncbi:hypothetical protein CC80DRAFT_157786 [Byssothecium circinans]|uniref:Uncharacterized protein n=1 Tax=Byssothecium circinans TaxID=147558 RepID=A0A6A5UBH3_9PLEO|nr:hypothetical protein CC80DRAFT_157786 [Byssothecium circinans]